MRTLSAVTARRDSLKVAAGMALAWLGAHFAPISPIGSLEAESKKRRKRRRRRKRTTTRTFLPLGGGGRVINLNQTSWAAARDATAGTAAMTGQYSVRAFQNAPTDQTVHRIFLPFDTSSLGANATILSATLRLFRSDSFQPFGNEDSVTVDVVATSPASDHALTVGDFNDVTYASKGALELASTINNAYNDVPIGDLSAINRTGTTRIGAILSNDLSNTPPSGDNGFGAAAPNHPQLVVTFRRS
jgi:hypothetical protein